MALCLTVPADSQTRNWPQWRGPDRTDISQETGLLKEWPDGGPQRVWLFQGCGLGYSGPSIVDGRLFIMGGRDEVEQLLCLDVETGKELWATDMGDLFENNWGDGPRGTPTVDGDMVYALSSRGNLICARITDGSIVWKTLMQDYGGSVPQWGYAESPLIDGEQVVCTPGGKQGAIVALNKLTGEKLWQSEEFTDGAQYVSLVVAEHMGTRQYVQLTQRSVVGVEAQTGRLMWQEDWPGRVAVIPTPIYHDGCVYVTSGYGSGCKLLKLNDNGDAVTKVYDNKASRLMKNHHGGVLLYQDHLYGYSDGVGWLCQAWLSGEQVWRDRRSLGKGAVAFADGMLYCLTEEDGEVVLVEASPNGWNEKGRFVLEPQTELRKSAGRIWTHPVIVNGKLFLRDQELLFCYDVKERP